MNPQYLPNTLSEPTAGSPDLIVLLAMLGVGVTLWVAGAKIAKVMCASSGLLAGAALAVTFTPEGKDLPTVLLITAAGSIAGIILGLMLFRLWVAISCAVVFAALAPAGMLLWQAHTGQPPTLEPLRTAPQDIVDVAFNVLSTEHQPNTGLSLDTTLSDDPIDQISSFQRTKTWYQTHVRKVHRTWLELGQQPRWITFAATAVAGLIGLGVGLIGPNVAAAAQSAVVGSILMVIGAEQVINMTMDALPQWWPQAPETRIAALAGIAALGVGIQLLLTRRESDD